MVPFDTSSTRHYAFIVSDKHGYDPYRDFHNRRKTKKWLKKKNRERRLTEYKNKALPPAYEKSVEFNTLQEYPEAPSLQLKRAQIAFAELNMIGRNVATFDRYARLVRSIRESDVIGHHSHGMPAFFHRQAVVPRDKPMRKKNGFWTKQSSYDRAWIEYDLIGLGLSEDFVRGIKSFCARHAFHQDPSLMMRCFLNPTFVAKTAKNNTLLSHQQFKYMNAQHDRLGKHILTFLLDQYLDQAYDQSVIADLTKVRHILMQPSILEAVADALDLSPYFQLKGIYFDEAPTVVRSIIASYFLYEGYEACCRFVFQDVLPEMIKKAMKQHHSVYYIEYLEKLIKHLGHTQVEYRKHNVPQENEVHIVGVYANEKLICEGYGKSFSDAQLNGATTAYNEVMKERSDTLFLPSYRSKHIAAAAAREEERQREHQFIEEDDVPALTALYKKHKQRRRL
eukprot:CAMPEP_0117420030 /NCGR_PEP_ID=MMETSP0758-20121206/1460_1 /TAXON_ID=63605 /ORGANISM="Percolomonas cosmopolitus, Strain AE-1 (ATCC 50343)" /LENGTH=450 /DNA_ID=CAMNT_0005201423 /DNA_START=63 /DNA_END=1412 /DNA_ORIENTATION=+